MAQVRWTAESSRWLREIHAFIAHDNPTAADRTVAGIHERAAVLVAFPEVGYRYRADRDVRILLHGHCRIAYLIDPSRDIVILGVFHGKLDIERLLQ